MFPPTRHHSPGWWSREGRTGVRMVATALARLIDAESRRSEWREPGWKRRQQRTPSWRREPRRFDGPPRGSPPRRTPAHGRWMPHHQGDPRRESDWQRQRPEQRPRHWRGSMRPRRGPPVAAIRVPHWSQEEWGKRRPRGSDPRGGLCGGPGRSANEPRRESLEAVCAESPEGQPMNHRRHPRQPRNGPTVEVEKRRSLGKAKDPPSSRWMRRGVSDGGGRSPEPRQEELGPSWRK